MPSPTSSPQNSAQMAHLQELQHQVSVKTLAHQTLHREYTALLQKLERMRVKTAALETKFEVTDKEINSLSDEKEKLTSQVQTLEAQIEDLQQARDEARKSSAESAAQYMKIVEMAGRLHGQGVEKKGWETEREALLGRIRQLEGEQSGSTSVAQAPGTAPSEAPTAADTNERQQGEVATLQNEIQALKERNASLESALKLARQESLAVRAAAVALASCGQRIDSTVNTALRDREQNF